MKNNKGRNGYSYREIVGPLAKVNGHRSATNSMLIALLFREVREAQADRGDKVPWRKVTSSQAREPKRRQPKE